MDYSSNGYKKVRVKVFKAVVGVYRGQLSV